MFYASWRCLICKLIGIPLLSLGMDFLQHTIYTTAVCAPEGADQIRARYSTIRAEVKYLNRIKRRILSHDKRRSKSMSDLLKIEGR